MVLVFICFFRKCDRSLHSLNSSEVKLNLNRRQVIFIIGQGRTGSTLLGSIFNEHEDVLYLFEPLIAVEKYHNLINFMLTNQSAQTFINLKFTQFLNDIMKCEYHEKHDGYLKALNFGQFRFHSKKLSSTPFCKESCGDVTAKLMNNLCSDKNLRVVIKDLEFRLPNKDLSFLQYMSKLNDHVDVNVIHLVRDPRAYLASMMNAGWFKNQNEDIFIKERCEETLNNIEYFTENNAKQSKSFINYKLLRFEDFADDPLHISEKIHRFLKLNFSQNVKNYISLSTSGKATTSSDPYSSSARNISSVKNGWRIKVTFDFVQKIQNSCNKLMKVLSYTDLSTKIALKDLTIPTTKTLETNVARDIKLTRD